ncbi:MAG: M28 family peptidase [Ignavibacteriaceae bacterium]|nr:M28 family peptidase [Ignavibacteriaceae bacterium]
MKKLIIFAVTIFAVNFTYRQAKDTDSRYIPLADSIVSIAMNKMEGYKILGELSKAGPRLSGSENLQKAEKFISEYMKGCGFDTVYMQEVKAPWWERGDQEICILKSDGKTDKNLSIAALGGSIAADLTADVIELSSFDDLEQKKDQVAGKIVFFNVPFNQKNLYTFASYGEPVGYRVSGPSRAAKYGAVAVLIRSVTSLYDNVPHTGTLRYADSVKQIPGAALGVQDAIYLSEKLKAGKPLQITLKMNCVNRGEATVHNIIGEIRGKSKPDEIIVVGGHFDSWDKGDGSHDDGGGCVQSVEVLKLIKQVIGRPERTIRCVLFANEENGLKGAIEYAGLAEKNNEYHYAAIESDRGVFAPLGFNIDADSATIARINEWLPVLRRSRIEWVEKGGSGADISRIKGARALIGYVPDSQRYFDVHHSDNDVYSAVNAREMELGSASMAILTMLLSEVGLD